MKQCGRNFLGKALAIASYFYAEFDCSNKFGSLGFWELWWIIGTSCYTKPILWCFKILIYFGFIWSMTRKTYRKPFSLSKQDFQQPSSSPTRKQSMLNWSIRRCAALNLINVNLPSIIHTFQLNNIERHCMEWNVNVLFNQTGGSSSNLRMLFYHKKDLIMAQRIRYRDCSLDHAGLWKIV